VSAVNSPSDLKHDDIDNGSQLPLHHQHVNHEVVLEQSISKLVVSRNYASSRSVSIHPEFPDVEAAHTT
jgi:hypothetical protein